MADGASVCMLLLLVGVGGGDVLLVIWWVGKGWGVLLLGFILHIGGNLLSFL